MTLTEFLLARIAEDEAVATLVQSVLAEDAAKRAIVALHGPVGIDCRSCGTAYEHGVDYPCPTLRALAVPYANHPDYDQAWRP